MGYDFRDCGGAWHHVGNTASYRETEQAECSSGTPTYYAFEEWSLANQQWQPYGGGTSDYCQCQAVGAC